MTCLSELKLNLICSSLSDQNIRYQQNLAGRRIAILELSTNDLRRIQAARSLIEDTISEMQSSEFKQLNIP